MKKLTLKEYLMEVGVDHGDLQLHKQQADKDAENAQNNQFKDTMKGKTPVKGDVIVIGAKSYVTKQLSRDGYILAQVGGGGAKGTLSHSDKFEFLKQVKNSEQRIFKLVPR